MCNQWNNHLRVGEEGSCHCKGYSEWPVLFQGDLHGRGVVGWDVPVRRHLGSDRTGTLWAIFTSALLKKTKFLIARFCTCRIAPPLENNCGKTYNSCVGVEWLFGRPVGRYEVVPSVGVPTAIAAWVNLITVDKLLFAVTAEIRKSKRFSNSDEASSIFVLTSVQQLPWF